LYDREVPPLTLARQHLVQAINRRPGCAAVLTGKRALENYRHREANWESPGVTVDVDDESDIPERVARQIYEPNGGPPWDQRPRRSRQRLRDRAKHWLNTAGVERMTPERLAQRDPQDDFVRVLPIIARLVDGPGS
jgi:hypothetical protein